MRVSTRIYILLALVLIAPSVDAQDAPQTKVEVTFSEVKGIGVEEGVMRRDPSDVIKVGDQFYVWYTKGAESGGYNGAVWYATSPDRHNWTEKGEAVARGEKMHAVDGLTFAKTHDVTDPPHAPGAYRAEAFTDSSKGERIEWGVENGQKRKKSLPISQRFDLGACESVQVTEGENRAKGSLASSRPQFSWDHVPLYMHVRKSKAFTRKELEYLAGFPLITLEKTTGSKTHGSSEAGARAAAKAIKALNPDARILYYRNVICNYSSYDVNSSLKDVPNAFLQGKDGNKKLHQGMRELYDLSNPAVRNWWLDHCVEMAGHDEIDGLFLDGNIKALSPGYGLRDIGADKKQKVIDGYELMMEELKDRVPENKLLVANIIRARLSDSGLSYLKYFDGSYLEGIETPAGGLSRDEYLAKGIGAIQNAAREGKIICMSIGLGEEALTGLKIDDRRKKLAPDANLQSRLDYCLALFLICAEKHSYFFPHDGYSVNGKDSSVWLTRFPDFDKPLGPPRGPAVQDGYTYTREFESASVFLDIEKKQGKVIWK